MSIERALARVHAAVVRRWRLMGCAPRCPACRTRQVELIKDRPLAGWKCRQCGQRWRFEPLVRK